MSNICYYYSFSRVSNLFLSFHKNIPLYLIKVLLYWKNVFRALHDQTDRALSDTQGQLTQIEVEFAHAQERVRELEGERSSADHDIGKLRNDITVLKSSLSKLDADKDALLVSVITY